MLKRTGHSLVILLTLLSMTAVCCCGLEALMDWAGADSTLCSATSEPAEDNSHCDQHDGYTAQRQVGSSHQSVVTALCFALPSNPNLWAAPAMSAPRVIPLDHRLHLKDPTCERITPLLS